MAEELFRNLPVSPLGKLHIHLALVANDHLFDQTHMLYTWIEMVLPTFQEYLVFARNNSYPYQMLNLR